MKNILNITNSGEQLISSIDDGTNQLIINDSVIPESQYIGSGTYSATISGHNITITKTTGSNIMLIRNSEYNYSLVDVNRLSQVYSDGSKLYINGTEYELPITEYPTSEINTSVGTLKAAYFKKYGNVVLARFTVKNDSSVASGHNFYEGTIVNSELIPSLSLSSGSYYGGYAIGGSLGTDGKIIVRNASPSALTISGNNAVAVTFTYII